jgi:alpha-1,2-mannosyltransferase
MAMVVAATVAGAVHGDFKDLLAYQHGARSLLDGEPVYGSREPIHGLPFTYPPFAAVVLVPIALLPAGVAAGFWTGVSVGALAAGIVVVRQALGKHTSGRLVLVLGIGAFALEPVWQTVVFGQVNLILMLLLLIDLLRPERRLGGVLVGVLAGLKLTPLVFIVLLFIVGRRAAAGRASLAFLVTVAIGFVALPSASTSYWTDRLVDASRVGPPALAHNQSVYGVLTRLLHGPPPTLLWLVIAVPLAVAALLVAAAWWRRGDALLGICLAAMAMLLASPVSWSHHWVWAVPVALVLWERSQPAAVAWTAVFVARPMVWLPWGDGREYGWSPFDHVVGNAYVLAALVLVTWAALALRAGAETEGETSRSGRLTPWGPRSRSIAG